MRIDKKIQELLVAIEFPETTYGDIDTCTVLHQLASISSWSETEVQRVAFLSKRLDISKKLFLGYLDSGRRATELVVTDPQWLELAVAILLKAALQSQERFASEMSLKRFNLLYKMLDIHQPQWVSVESELGKSMESGWSMLLGGLPVAHELPELPESSLPQGRDDKVLKPIRLTVLFYEGPIARAYLETIKSLGFRPQKIVELVAAKDVSTKKNVGKWLPEGMRKAYAASIQRSKINYWPKQLLTTQTVFIDGVLAEVGSKFGFSKTLFHDAHSLLPLSTYSDDVESVLIDGLADPALQKYLEAVDPGAVLFTGGGIVPADLLYIQHLKFLHIHPGYLPKIRGADCALWSSLLTGHTSATCFYMAPGIDTGDIVLPRWLPRLDFTIDSSVALDLQTMYRAVYGFVDPWVRAFVLREVLSAHSSFENLDSVPQSIEDGTTFHFMHNNLRRVALERIFCFPA